MHSDAALLAANIVAWCMLGSALLVFPTLLFVTAPYGRYGRSGWGIGIPARLAWMVRPSGCALVSLRLVQTQEVPSLLFPATMLVHSLARGASLSLLQLAPLLAFMLHYAWRSIVFPLIMKSSRPTPLSVWLLAFAFCCLNGFQQGVSCLLQPPNRMLHSSAADTAATVLGLVVWAAGLAVNVHADMTLCRLRKQSAAGYQIPRGGAFKYVSAANYFGECLEWAGWVVAVRSLPAVSFACFTFANLAPRGLHHHRFYLQKFEDYPKQRRAVIPFVW